MLWDLGSLLWCGHDNVEMIMPWVTKIFLWLKIITNSNDSKFQTCENLLQSFIAALVKIRSVTLAVYEKTLCACEKTSHHVHVKKVIDEIKNCDLSLCEVI